MTQTTEGEIFLKFRLTDYKYQSNEEFSHVAFGESDPMHQINPISRAEIRLGVAVGISISPSDQNIYISMRGTEQAVNCSTGKCVCH